MRIAGHKKKWPTEFNLQSLHTTLSVRAEMRGAGYVHDPAEGVQEVLARASHLLDRFVHPHLPGALDAAAELWPWLLAAWAAGAALLMLFLAGLYSTVPEPRRWYIPRGSRDPRVQDHAVAAPDGVVLRGISKGSGPPVVLLHGAGCTSDIFSFLFKRFSLRGYRVFAFDLRGHGDSDAVASLSAEALAGDLRAVLDTLDLSDATLVGHGLGGYAAVALAQYHPATVEKRVGRMVLLSAFAETPPEMQSTLGKFYRAAFAWCLMHIALRWRAAARLLMRPFFGRSITSTLEEEWRRAVLNCPRKVWMRGLSAGARPTHPEPGGRCVC
jgi:pimeloyl-ACP methyl ester carboxylesterase